MVDERKYWVWLSMCLGQGSMVAGMIIRYFGTALDAIEAGYDEIAKCLKKDKVHVQKMLTQYTFEDAEYLVAWCDSHNVRILTIDDEDYPRSIRNQINLPLVLYAVGKIPKWNERFSCAIVGTRKMTDYGKQTAYDFGYDLSAGGAIVVSGMALGVDGMAMAGALSAGGPTVAVLGCGIDICYPKAHRTLMKEVLKTGAVITEYPPASPPDGKHFPIRNRIISGISQATVVIEGDDNSGALITANHAIYQGKAVFAVPGKITDESSNGPNSLIKHGVPAVTEACDVLLEFSDAFADSINTNRLRRKYLSKKPDEYLDVADRYHVVSSLDKETGFYGKGLYGGRDKEKYSPESIAARSVPVEERNILKRFAEKTEMNGPQKKEKKTVKQETQPVPENAEQKSIDYTFLEDQHAKVYNAMKPDVPMLVDELVAMGFDVSEVLVAMTMLEIAGVVEASPGGHFTRLGAEELTVPPKDE